MKSNVLIIATLLTLQTSFLFAGSRMAFLPPTSTPPVVEVMCLAPVAPVVATFEDAIVPVPEVEILAPVTPAEAEFGDSVAEINPALLAPATPAEADFE